MKGASKNPDFSSGQPKGYPELKFFPRLAFGRTLNF